MEIIFIILIVIIAIAGLECMGKDCEILVPEDFALSKVTKSELREKYQRFAFSDYVKVNIL